MAFISEIHYKSGLTSIRKEFIEVTLAPGERPEDFVVSFYGLDRQLKANPGDFGRSELFLSDPEWVSAPDPENPNWTVYTLSAKDTAVAGGNVGVLFTGGTNPSFQTPFEANFVALTDITSGNPGEGTLYAYGVGDNGPTNAPLIGGWASNVMVQRTGLTFAQSLQWDSEGNAVDGTNQTFTPNNAVIICFSKGTLIDTENGLKKIENLGVGDLVLTKDNGLKAIRWIGSRKLKGAELSRSPNLKPIKISQGSLGCGMPSSDLIVSPQHRILVRSEIAQRMFSAPEILVAAKHLLEVNGIDVLAEDSDVEYFHLLFDDHEIIFANGAEAESLFLASQSLKSMTKEALAEIYEIFPELHGKDQPDIHNPARTLISGREGRQLAKRHVKNNRALFSM